MTAEENTAFTASGFGIVLACQPGVLSVSAMTRARSSELPGSTSAALSAPSLYEYVRHHLSNPAVFAFYVVGVVSACYHLGNGLFGFAIHWGLVTGERAQRRMGRFGLAFALVLSLVGINAMLAFVGRGINPFPKTHVTEATVALPPAAGTR